MRRKCVRLHILKSTMSVTLSTTATSVCKRTVNFTLNEGLVAQAKTYASNLSATMEELLAGYVAQQQQARLTCQQQADAAAMNWNALHASVGSFAEEHSTL